MKEGGGGWRGRDRWIRRFGDLFMIRINFFNSQQSQDPWWQQGDAAPDALYSTCKTGRIRDTNGSNMSM